MGGLPINRFLCYPGKEGFATSIIEELLNTKIYGIEPYIKFFISKLYGTLQDAEIKKILNKYKWHSARSRPVNRLETVILVWNVLIKHRGWPGNYPIRFLYGSACSNQR